VHLQDSVLTEDDFVAVVRILADIATMSGPMEAKRNRLMAEIAQLIGTERWLWAYSPGLEAGKQPVYLFQHHGGFDEEGLNRLIRAVEHPDTGAMTASLIQAMMEEGAHVTRLRQEIVTHERHESSPSEPLWRAADVGPLILSFRPMPDGGTSVAAFYRRVNEPFFSPRESRLAHIILTSVPWLHEPTTPHSIAAEVPKLPPRCRLILSKMGTGRSRKEIAADLGLSHHTVSGYIKQIFTHFNVHSQAQLIALLRNGDGRDRGTEEQVLK
jgi:DNA-binding CsgD family transcriptional regulator